MLRSRVARVLEKLHAETIALAVAAGLGLTTGAPAATITGVCPDGSVFVVRTPEAIPCAQAKQVQPHEVPPLRPENLPRPYTWQVYNETNNPNDAYNLVDSARQVRALRDAGSGHLQGNAPRDDGRETQGATRLGSGAEARAARAASAPVDLGLTDEELRDLFFIVELSQPRSPANFSQERADGTEVVRVSLAYSEAFQTRVEQASRAAGGVAGKPVLLFSALARAATPFYANFTFTQAHLTFQPRVDDPRQLGVLQGHLGPLEADEAVLGYVILPEQMQLELPVDVYWNDRRASVTFRP